MIKVEELHALVEKAHEASRTKAAIWAENVLPLIEPGIIEAAKEGIYMYYVPDELIEKDPDVQFMFKVSALAQLLPDLQVKFLYAHDSIEISWKPPL